jgi:RHS repeat-associated protein
MKINSILHRMETLKRLFSLGALCIITAFSASAGHLEFSQRLYSIPSTQTVDVTDQLTVDVTPKTGSFADAQVGNLLTLGVDHHYADYFGSAMAVKIKVNILTYNASNTLVSTYSKYLEINYDPFGGVYKDKAIYLFSDAYKFRATIDSIYVNGSSQSTLPGNLFLEGFTYIERYYNFSSAASTPNVISGITAIDRDCDTINDEIEITWPVITGAEEYHLEWTFVNDYLDGVSYMDDDSLTCDFRNNSTRITTTSNNYTIPLLFDHGYVVFRVRSVARDYLNPENYIFSVWSLPDVNVVGDLDSSRYFITIPHEGDKNWQATTTFAEEGKKKEVVSYFDGSLRNRQTITRINTDSNTIVGQTIYDHQGRPAITVLPVPVVEPSCDTSIQMASLKYYPNFNKDDSLNQYSRNDFDIDNPDSTCAVITPGMSDSTGASNYYSPENANQEGIQAYVPDAQLYPFVQVEYTPDNTGRIRSQGGVGPDHQLGTGHETKYYYGQPNQIQLDRMFGSEVGSATHYKKNVVVDPNGQVSVSYMDQEGRVIATSLAGDSTQNLIALESEGTALDELTIDLFSKNSNGESGTNTINLDSTGIEYSTQLLVAYGSTFDFEYTIEIDTLNDPCLKDDVCFHCVYDLQIQIYDECQSLVYSSDTIVGHFTIDSSQIVFDTICTSPSETTYDDSFSVFLSTGNYTVIKKLTVNEDAIDFYVAAYLDTTNNSCVMTLADFEDLYLSQIDTSDCYIDCEACLESLGERDEFVAAGTGTAFEYDRRYEECQKLCPQNPTMCEAAYLMLLADVSLGGQYGQYLTNSGSNSPGSFPLSVFNESNYLPENIVTSGLANWRYPEIELNGTTYAYYVDELNNRSRIYLVPDGANYIPEVDNTSSTWVILDPETNLYYTFPENLAEFSDFSSNWKSTWAQSLVIYHPEYCYYETCLGYSEKQNTTDTYSSDDFDQLLFSTTTFSAAETADLIKSNYSTFADPNDRVEDWFTNNSVANDPWDPFVVYVSGYGASLENKFDAHTTSGSYTYSMIEIAAIMARCGNLVGVTPGSTCMLFGSDYIPGGPSSINDSIRNLEWNNLKNLYLSYKQVLQAQRADAIALTTCETLNDCIGDADFNPAASGMLSGGFGFSGSAYASTAQPCSFHNKGFYLNKQQRFPDPQNIQDQTGASDIHAVNYQLYLQTGQCPNARSLQQLLSALAANDALDSTDVYLLSYQEFTAYALAANYYATDDDMMEFEWDWDGTSSGDTLDISVTTQGGTELCAMELVKNPSDSISWDDILFFTNLQATILSGGKYYFTVIAAIANPSDSLFPYHMDTLTGYTCSNILNCNFPVSCQPNDLANDLNQLMTALASDGDADGSNINLESAYPSLLTPRIRAALGTPNTALRWSWDLSTHSFLLFNNGDTCRRIRIQVTAVDPTTFNFYNIDSIIGFSGLNSSHEHYFSIDGLDEDGETIVTFDGRIVLEECSDTSQIILGSCGHPTPASCLETGHLVREDLEDLLHDVLIPFEDSIDIFTSPYLSDLLLSFMPDSDSATTSQYVHWYSAGDTLHMDTLRIFMDNCYFELTHSDNDDPALPLDSLVSLDELVAYGDVSYDGNMYTFYMLASYSINDSIIIDTLYGSSCWPLRNCDPCPDTLAGEEEEESMMMMSFSMEDEEYLDSLDLANGITWLDNSMSMYHEYKIAIDSLNDENSWSSSDSLFVTAMSYQDYRNHGYQKMHNSYMRFIENYVHGLDSHTWLVEPIDFALQYGTGYNVKREFDRYVGATFRYNDRADTEGLDPLDTMTRSSFYTESMAEKTTEYVAYLETYPLSGDPGLSMEDYFGGGMMMLMSLADSCDSLYQLYLIAYDDFEDYQALNPTCLDYEETAPLYSYQDFLDNNLCCSDTGLALINEYIEILQDTLQCPGPLPYLATCDTVPDSTCFLRYIQFLDDLEEYNDSDYASWANDSLDENIYPTFESFMRAGLCSCQDEYHEYLAPYLVSPADTTLSEPLSIDEYGPCNIQIVGDDPCKQAYTIYFLAVTEYNAWAETDPDWGTIGTPASSTQFTAGKLCYCVESYVAFLNAVMEGLIPFTDENERKLAITNQCPDLTPVCDPTAPIGGTVVSPEVTIENPCVEYLTEVALFNAQNAYNNYIDSMSTVIRESYMDHCLSALETFTATYDDKEYHFTLYYYDQAGNLVKTIPPQGVQLLDIDAPTDAVAVQINSDRTNGTHSVFTSHLLATTYEYNSLNQLVKQNMPDHDPMTVWETTLPNGLDSRLQITEINYTDANIGYLSGFIDYGASVTRGLAYTTEDGGATWKKLYGLAGTNLKKIFWVNDTLAYGVGTDGIAVKTIDGGNKWDVLNAYRNHAGLAHLNDVYFSSATLGVFVGNDATILRTADGGNTIATYTTGYSSTSVATDSIVSVTGNGNFVYISVIRSQIYHTHGLIYRATNISTPTAWGLMGPTRVVDYQDVQYISNGYVNASGTAGFLSERLKPTTTWTYMQKTTGTAKTIKKIHFMNQNEGIAIIDSVSGYGQIYKTTDRGTNWELISEPGDYYNSFYAYKETGTHKLIAVGRDRLVHRIVMVSGQPFGIIPMSLPPSTANNNFQACWAAEQTDGSTWIFAGNDNGNIYFTDDGSDPTQNWIHKTVTPLSPISGGVRQFIFKQYTSGSTITLSGVILNNTATPDAFPIFYNSSGTLSTGTWGVVPPGSAFFMDLDVDHANNRVYAMDRVGQIMYYVSINGTSISTAITAMTGGIPTAPATAMDYSQNDTIWTVYDAGQAYFGKINNGTVPPTITWTNEVNTGAFYPLRDITFGSAANTLFGCGDGGYMIHIDVASTQLRRLETNITENLNAIKMTSATGGYLAADNGKFYSFTIAGGTTVTCTEITTPVTVNLNDFDVSGNVVYIVGDNGTVLYTTNITTTALAKATYNSSSNLYGVAIKTGTTTAYACGDESTIAMLFGPAVVPQKNIFLPKMKSIHFYDSQHGFALADNYNIRYTDDAGKTWSPVKPSATIGATYPVINRIISSGSSNGLAVGNSRYYLVISDDLIGTQGSVSNFGATNNNNLTDISKVNGNLYVTVSDIVSNTGYLYYKPSGSPYVLKKTYAGTPLNAVRSFTNGNCMVTGKSGRIAYYNVVTDVTTNFTAPTGLTTHTFNEIFFHDDINGYVVGENGVVLRATDFSLDGNGYLVFGSWTRMETDDNLNTQTDSTNMNILAIGFGSRYRGMMGGSYTSSPKSYARRIHDETGLYSTYFWYDKLGRIVLSQNTKQFARENKSYSYSRYDALGRVFEAGELSDTCVRTNGTIFAEIFGDTIANYFNPDVINNDSLTAFIENNERIQVTRSWYDSTRFENLPNGFAQTHIRKRIAHVTYEEVYDGYDSTYQHATHYSYDIHGNVKTLVQDNKKLADSTDLDDQQFKRIDYTYDIISGATRQVSYQRDSVDAFHHKYEYDSDSRITAAYTSNYPDPNVYADALWDNDAKYFYYALGELARLEIGDLQVQGIDYVYTILGLYKNVNSNTLDSLRDPGKDGLRDSSNVNFNFPKDVFGYSLGYYTDDYLAIDTSFNGVNSPISDIIGSDVENQRYDLFNGNVSSMVTTITDPTTREVLPLGNAYKYDQLNRLKEARSFTNLNPSTNEWGNTGSYNGKYFNSFSYDANGNILGQLRKDNNGSVIDSLTYQYAKNSNNQIIQNRLYHVNDTTDYNSNDIDDMGVFDDDLSDINTNNNYGYTEIGELKFDKQEEIEEVVWTVRGKVKAILRPDSSSKKEFAFDYDARDLRIAKHVYSSSGEWEKSTYYIRDFSGNILSVYDHSYNDSTSTMSYTLKEQNIYGSSRLGFRKDSIEMIGSSVDSVNFERILGKKQYELINHLGNVLSIVSDKKIPMDDNADGTVDRYLAEITSAVDYSPFGVALEGRNFNSSNSINGFNGTRKDDDIKGAGNSYDFSFRVYDPRLGRFMSVDPFAANYSYNSTYAFAENRVIEGVDIEGLEFGPGVIPRFKSHPVINNNPGLPEGKPLGEMYQDWYPLHEPSHVPNSKRNPTRMWCSSCQSGSGNSNGKPGYSFVQMGQWQTSTIANTTIATTITPPRLTFKIFN